MDNEMTFELNEDNSAAENIPEEEETVNFEPAVEDIPDPKKTEKGIRKRIRKLYNSACFMLLVQLGVSSAVSAVITVVYVFIYTIIVTVMALSGSPELDTAAITEQVLEGALSPVFLIATTAVSYLIANIAAYFIGNAMTNKHRRVKIFGKIKMKPFDCILAVLSIIGMQMISLLVQTGIMALTGLSGVDETTGGMFAFSDNIFQNVLLVLYTVIIAAITEELLCRGVLMKAFSVKSATFALFASSLLFGFMHGNFNQIFNGFLLGLVIGYAALKSRSIILPIILHMCANGHAMLLSFFEYRFAESIVIPELIYMIVVAVIGLAATILLVVRNGAPKSETDGYDVVSTVEGVATLENQKGLTWRTLFKSVMFWIFMIIYTLMALFTFGAVLFQKLFA